MYSQLQRRLAEHVRAFLRRQYDLELATIVIEQPPKVEMGEYALPLAFELARKLRKAPRKIAEEIVGTIGRIEGFEKLEVAGAGYINARLDRPAAARQLMAGDEMPDPAGTWRGEKILVEHTSINPNKAAHIGHLRNAILGDTFVRLLRAGGRHVDVQNYIDNTGVQVADVVVGFVHLEKKSKAEIEQLIESHLSGQNDGAKVEHQDTAKVGHQPFDFLCWDLYAQVSQWYERDKENLQRRGEMLHAIEHGGNEYAAMAERISTAILRRHLETMGRLDIEYDFLPRESEILHLKFWDAAFQQLKDKGVLYYETQGKNAGCWVMKRPSAAGKSADEQTDEDTKVIVRSNGTVGYVGKDIAYHLWKFGLLGRDFGYCKFYRYPNGHEVWISAEHGEPDHPHFGGVSAIYNVIDARQAEAQNSVIEALRGMGYHEQAERYTHFSYEMVALTPRCAAELGYQLSEDEWSRNYIEVSGRRGFGVKADDLIDRLIGSARQEVDQRHSDLSDAERQQIATQIAVGALRYFMLKYTKNSVIAFDFKDALSFEGETGPYAQYAVVRATNIFRKAGVEPESALGAAPLSKSHPFAFGEKGGPPSRSPQATGEAAVEAPGFSPANQNAQNSGASAPADFAPYFTGEHGNEIWELWLAAAKTTYVVEQCITTTEPAYAAKHAFTLAQLFNNFYHRHHILTEPDPGRKAFLMATAAVLRRELIRVLDTMGITVPPVM